MSTIIESVQQIDSNYHTATNSIPVTAPVTLDTAQLLSAFEATLSAADRVTVLSLMAQLNVAFLGIVITLVALLPTLISLAESLVGNLMAELTKRRILRGLKYLRYSLWLFGFTTILSVMGMFFDALPSYILLLLVVLLSAVGFSVVIWASTVIARTSAEIMTSNNAARNRHRR